MKDHMSITVAGIRVESWREDDGFYASATVTITKRGPFPSRRQAISVVAESLASLSWAAKSASKEAHAWAERA